MTSCKIAESFNGILDPHEGGESFGNISSCSV